MNLAIHSFLKKTRIRPVDVDEFLSRKEFPIVEGSSVTFVFRGEAEGVRLQHWIYGLASALPFSRVSDTDLWYLTLQLPEQSRIEYKIAVERNGAQEWILDPLNPQHANDPFGSNSVCHAEGYERPEWTLPHPASRQGLLEERGLNSACLGRSQAFQVYLPARFRRRRRYPLLIIQDGPDYLKYAQLKTVLDNLIHRLEVSPMIAVFLQSPNRLEEYGASDRYAAFLHGELLPFLQEDYPLHNAPGSRGLMGASFGAVASLHAAWKYPGVFGRLLIQSGSFVFSDIGTHQRGPVFDSAVDFVNEFRRNPGRPSERLFVTCGIYEPLIYENRSLIPLLQQTGMEVRFIEARDGHNWENWRDRLRDGLSWLFPGPLWLVYE